MTGALVVAAAGWSPARVWEMPGGRPRAEHVHGARYVSWAACGGIPRVVGGADGIVNLSTRIPDPTRSGWSWTRSAHSKRSRAGGGGPSYVAVGYASAEIRIWEPESGDVRSTLTGMAAQSRAWPGRSPPIGGSCWPAARGTVWPGSGTRVGRVPGQPAGRCLSGLAGHAGGRPTGAGEAGQSDAVQLWDPVRARWWPRSATRELSRRRRYRQPSPGEQGGLPVAFASWAGSASSGSGSGAERGAGPAAGPPAGRVGGRRSW